MVKNLKSFLPALFALSLVFVLAAEAMGQCGVYLKRKYTRTAPDANLYLDKAEDMTGDGLPDLILGRRPSVPSTVLRDRIYILPNDGKGTFGTPIILDPPAGSSFWAPFSVGRVNGDALNDFVFQISGSSSVVRSYINNGNGTFTASADSTTEGLPGGTLMDFNDDGINDLNLSQGDFKYRIGAGDGTFGTNILVSSLSGQRFTGDFNGDGKVDVISSARIHMNQGGGNYVTTTITPSFSEGIRYVRDFNGDGKWDVLTIGGKIHLRDGDAFAGPVQLPLFNESNPDSYNWRIGNFSGSAAIDIIYDDEYRNRTRVYTNDGAGNFTAATYRGAFDPEQIADAVLNDFTGDGKVDRLMLSSSAMNNSRLMISDVSSYTLQANVCDRPGQARIVDFDYSNTTDYSFWNSATGEWSSQTNIDSFPATETVNWGLGSLGDVPAVGDYDGDGITDRAVYRNSTGVWYVRRSSDSAWFVLNFGLPGDKPVPADYDGDTISDIAVFRPSEGNWYIWLMGPQQFRALHFGADGDAPAPADFDGDQQTDVAVFRPSTGVWYYLRSTDWGFNAFHWGISEDKPIPADYDGDGRADVTVYRPSTRTFYILRSYDLTARYFLFGAAGDVPQVLDFDGDYVADIGMYRPSNQRWYLTASVFQVALGGTGMPTSSILRIE